MAEMREVIDRSREDTLHIPASRTRMMSNFGDDGLIGTNPVRLLNSISQWVFVRFVGEICWSVVGICRRNSLAVNESYCDGYYHRCSSFHHGKSYKSLTVAATTATTDVAEP